MPQLCFFRGVMIFSRCDSAHVDALNLCYEYMTAGAEEKFNMVKNTPNWKDSWTNNESDATANKKGQCQQHYSNILPLSLHSPTHRIGPS